MELKKRFAGIQEITRLLYNVNFAGTNTKEEFCELQNNMIKMLSYEKYTYSDIENYFVSWGYQPQLIGQVYKVLTGLEPERVNSTEYLFNIPGCLPGFNYGWGKGKGKYKYVFVINYKLGYGLFGQIDDINRELVQYTLDLSEALEALNKYGKDIKTCQEITVVPSKVLDKNILQPQLSSDYPVTQYTIFKGRTASLARAIEHKQMNSFEVRAMLRKAYDNKQISASEHKELYQYYLSRFAENAVEGDKDIEKTLEQTSTDLKEKSADNVDESSLEFQFIQIKKYADKIKDYLLSTLDDIFKVGNINIQGLVIKNKDDATNAIEKTPEVVGQNPTQYFNKVAEYEVSLGVTLNEMSEVGEQSILAIFRIDDKGNVTSDGQFKGVDDKLYPLNLPGIQSYLQEVADVENVLEDKDKE